MRAHDRGRAALLQFLRTQLRPENLPAPPRESTHRRDLFAMRQPRTFHAAAQSIGLVADSRMAHADVSGSIARTAFDGSPRCIHNHGASDTRGTRRTHCPRHSRRHPLVALDITSRLVSEARKEIVRAEEPER